MKKTYCDICKKEKEVDELLGAAPVASEVEIGESVIVIELRQKIKPPQDICLECAGKAIYDKFCGKTYHPGEWFPSNDPTKIKSTAIPMCDGVEGFPKFGPNEAAFGDADKIADGIEMLSEVSRSAKKALDLALDEIEKV